METREYTWDQLFRDIKEATRILLPKDFKTLVLISRGGLIPGALLSRTLNIPHIETVSIQSYLDHTRKVMDVLGKPFWEGNTSLFDPLIVDDVCDSGETLIYITNFVKAPVFTLFHKPKYAVFTPTYFLHRTTKWIKFPWEEQF